MARRLRSTSFLIAFAGMLSWPAAASARATFDGAACTPAATQETIALGLTVLSINPADILAKFTLRDDRQPRFTPVNPSQPIGCPGNPEQLSSVWIVGPRAPDGGIQYKMVLLQRVDFGARLAPATWTGEDLENLLVDTGCSRSSVIEKPSHGLTICWGVQPQGTTNPLDRAAYYAWDVFSYATPMGRRFSMRCDPILFTGHVGWCETSYVLKPGLGISYRFTPYNSPRAIPPKHADQYDQRLRDLVFGLETPSGLKPEFLKPTN
jgi:hypothetical protein